MTPLQLILTGALTLATSPPFAIWASRVEQGPPGWRNHLAVATASVGAGLIVWGLARMVTG